MTAPIVKSSDGPRITINDFLRDPELIPSFLLDIAAEEFLTDAVLRQAGPVDSGVVKYYESTPIYSDSNVEVRAEGGEVPIAMNSMGTPRVSYVEERALGIQITDEMNRRMNIDPVTRQLIQVRNTMTRSWEDTFLNAVLNAPTQAHDAPAAWGVDTTTTIYADLAEAVRLIETATAGSGDTASSFGFEPDTLIIGRNTKADLFKNTEFNTIYRGNTADENLRYRGVLPRQVQGLDVLTSRRMDVIAPNTAMVMQRNILGFIADEITLQASALYRDEPRKLWRSDVQRASAIGIDQPLAITIISGVSPTTP